MLSEILGSPVFFYSVVLLTAVLSAALGAGGGFILIPLAAMQFGAKEGIGIVTLYFLFLNISKISSFRKYVDWKTGRRVIYWSIPGMIIGSLLLGYFPVEIFTKFLACVILLYLANDVFKLVPKKHSPDSLLPILSTGTAFSQVS